MKDFEQELIELTQKLVRIDSTNPGMQEKNAAEFVYNWLKEEGVEPVKNKIDNNRFNVIVEITGSEKLPALVLTCHVDTVPVRKEEWSKEPFSGDIIDGKLYGRGSSDMKCGVALGMILMRDLSKSEKKLKRTVRMIMTVDEEDLMLGAVQAVKSGYVSQKDYVIDLDSSGNRILSGHKGKAWVELVVKGKETHVSTPQDGANAILGMAKLIQGIYKKIDLMKENKDFGKSYAAFTKIWGGKSISIIPDECHQLVDFRIVPPYSVENAYEIIEQSIKEVEQEIQGIHISYIKIMEKPVINFYPDSEIVVLCKEAYYQATGKSVEIGTMSGYTDSGVMAAMTGNTSCITFGPGLYSQAHKVDEYADCDMILESYKTYKILLQNLVY